MCNISRNRLRGFTLIELLVVIGIIAVLTGILLPIDVNAKAADIAALRDFCKIFAFSP